MESVDDTGQAPYDPSGNKAQKHYNTTLHDYYMDINRRINDLCVMIFQDEYSREAA